MKKNLLIFSLSIFTCAITFAQDSTEVSKVDEYNKWSIELGAGQSKGIKPYSPGYYASNPDKVLGSFTFNHFNLGVRYMFSPKFGLKLDGAFDNLQNLSDESLEFEMRQIRIGLQGVINAARLFDIQESLGRFGMLFHGGVQVAQMTPQMGINEGRNEWNGGIMVGFTPEFRVTKNLALTADFTLISNVRQHFNWDGSYSDGNNNLAGSMYTTSLGLSYSFGSHKIHGDFATITTKQQEEINALEKRVGQIENDMSDSDQDGVPDYLDAEPNSIAGVAVDTKGRMVDINQNGVPDELEKYLNNTYVTNQTYNADEKTSEMMKKFINDGYVATYFDFNKRQPTNVSTEGIDFIRTYLLNNPSASVDIIGFADEIGNTPYNNKLANDRATNVKNILMKAGITAERLNVISKGEDTSVDKDSAGARKLVRRVTFKVK
ncbi:OmpA family protein [Flavobacterium lacus]|uniref:OOP family OmpA-OmpF porin n=1 Tax=Flavobacterium lacus TaxID=1353778 RepID=A0A328WTK1_9FLAO|nr:OmpA family protein [Flavobacterium lacus]RAR48476.1 OOP family OmpA-OmpF porin [Flavobacterium lacus]